MNIMSNEKIFEVVEKYNNEEKLSDSLISKGSYGVVYKYDKDVAIKVIPYNKLYFSMFEILFMFYCDSDYIQTCSKIILHNSKIGIVQNLAQMDLKLFYDKMKMKGGVPNKYMFKFFKESIIGLNYLHCSNIIHGDIKPNNFLVYYENNEYYIKLTDFGLSRIKTDKNYQPFVFIFRPPEIFNNDICTRSDIWALGITFLIIAKWVEMKTKYVESYGQNIANLVYILEYVKSDHNLTYNGDFESNILITFDQSEESDENIAFYNLLVDTLQFNQNDRPFCSELLSSELLVNIVTKYEISSRIFNSDYLLDLFNTYSTDKINNENDDDHLHILSSVMYLTNQDDRNILNDLCISYLKDKHIISSARERDVIFFES